MTRSTGTLVKRKTTSKETNVVLLSRVCEEINLAKLAELRMLFQYCLLVVLGPGEMLGELVRR